MDQPQPQVMDGGIPRTGTPNKLRRGQQDACHLIILSHVKVNSVVESYKGETETSLMIRMMIRENLIKGKYNLQYTIYNFYQNITFISVIRIS